MRILHVHNINQVARIYTNELAMRGHTVTVYEPNLCGGFAPMPVKLAMMPWRIFDLRHVVPNLNPNHYDIVHVHWASYGVLGLASRIPFVVQCHGDDVLVPTFRPVLALIFRRAAAVIGITPDLIPLIQAVRPDALFIPGPIDTELFAPLNNNEVATSRPWTILLFSRLDPKKGPEIAMKGIVRFADRHPGVRVKVLDRGTLKEGYRRRYGDRFEFIPVVPLNEVPHLLQEADVVVGQFLSGALGLSELQAMSCGKPVIASFRYEEAYPTPPPLCQARNAEEIEEQLENLYLHPEVAKELGQKAREWVINHHNNQMLAVKLETLYQTILNERKGKLTSTSQLLA
jgi:glycosyltransferase involved in cell wall biosynthesis